jgi:hypothetical protein
VASEPLPPEQLDAYALLSKPTLDLTDEEVARVVVELRKKRLAFVQTGKPDKVAKPKPEKAAPLSKEEKQRNNEALLASLKLPGLD